MVPRRGLGVLQDWWLLLRDRAPFLLRVPVTDILFSLWQTLNAPVPARSHWPTRLTHGRGARLSPRRRKVAHYPEPTRGRLQRRVVVDAEIRGRWSEGCQQFFAPCPGSCAGLIPLVLSVALPRAVASSALGVCKRAPVK